MAKQEAETWTLTEPILTVSLLAMLEQSKSTESLFSVFAEVAGRSKPYVVNNLTFARLMDDVVIPYQTGESFFVDGAPVTPDKLVRIKLVRQRGGFEEFLSRFLWELRAGDHATRKLCADQYEIRTDALLRECGEDVTSQVIKAFNAKIKPSIKDYLPRREELINAAFQLFLEGIRALGSRV